MLTVIDEHSWDCLALVIGRRLTGTDVLELLFQLELQHGIPDEIRSDNGPESTAKVVRIWLSSVGVHTAFIEPGSPWECGYNESLNGKLRDELLNGAIFYTLKEAKGHIERWRADCETIRPYGALGCKPPAPECIRLPALSPWSGPGAVG
jgi:transposase InsO family protein